MPPTRNDPIAKEVVTLKCGRRLAYCEHGTREGEPIVFFPGAGFGRNYVPTPFPGLLEEHGARLITVDRPGYGASDPHPGRTYRSWAEDVEALMDHLRLGRARFVAHSAGTPHLAAVCRFAPQRVVAAAFVCPVTPLTGSPPNDRPAEGFARGFGRFFLLYLGGVIDKLFGSVFGKWQADPESYVKDTMGQIVAEKDVVFMKEHPEFFQVQYAADFGDAVKAPNGVSAMLQDMFHLNKVPWGFGYSDLAVSRSRVPVEVWWGSADDTAPHGKWVCGQLGIEGRCIESAGHGLVHSEFGPIIEQLLRVG
mmetsp:Transcript_3001/g.6640  ORF Transcript_3001/g.6640 Transcript_3001/m.6640 type:complete len:308 (-) Transcript_3001:396-1319(-)